MLSLWKRAAPCVGAFILIVAFPLAGFAQSFSDDFEAATINSYWTIYQPDGSIQLSSDQSYSGSQSVKMTSTGGGSRTILLGHTFPQLTKGTLSVWFYDTAPGQGTLYSGLLAFDSSHYADHITFGVNVADWDASTYIWHGPGTANTPTSVVRTLGWHEFTLQVTPTGFNALIDQTIVGSNAGDFTFDTVQLFLAGSGDDPNATFYFDDFKFTPPFTVPATKDACKDGGWQHLARADGSSFRNQGACVTYVNTGK